MRASDARDLEQLRLLSVFHYVLAILLAFGSAIPVLHLVIGIAILDGSFGDRSGQPPPALFGWFFVAIAVVLILAGLTLAVCTAVAGRALARRRRRTFCMVVAGILSVFFPFGTLLGVFTLVVLSRESVRSLFEPVEGALAAG